MLAEPGSAQAAAVISVERTVTKMGSESHGSAELRNGRYGDRITANHSQKMPLVLDVGFPSVTSGMMWAQRTVSGDEGGGGKEWAGRQ